MIDDRLGLVLCLAGATLLGSCDGAEEALPTVVVPEDTVVLDKEEGAGWGSACQLVDESGLNVEFTPPLLVSADGAVEHLRYGAIAAGVGRVGSEDIEGFYKYVDRQRFLGSSEWEDVRLQFFSSPESNCGGVISVLEGFSQRVDRVACAIIAGEYSGPFARQASWDLVVVVFFIVKPGPEVELSLGLLRGEGGLEYRIEGSVFDGFRALEAALPAQLNGTVAFEVGEDVSMRDLSELLCFLGRRGDVQFLFSAG